MDRHATNGGANGRSGNAIEVRGLRTQFGAAVIHDDLDLDVHRGEVLGLVGGSGTGKSVLLRTIIGLNRPTAGDIRVLGVDVRDADEEESRRLRSQWGVMFQDGALFSALTVLENIEVPLREHTTMSADLRREIAALKLSLAGLPLDAGPKFPSELSGGMRKRAGLARALALDPEIVFLDEPTAGLDPLGAAAFDELIAELQRSLGLTVVMVTHDLDSLHAICDRVAVLINKQTRVGTIAELSREQNQWIQDYFNGPRGRAAEQAHHRTRDPEAVDRQVR